MKIYTALTADEAELGKEYVYADNLQALYDRYNSGTTGKLIAVSGPSSEHRFCIAGNDTLKWALIAEPTTKFVPFKRVSSVIARSNEYGILWLRSKFGKRLYIVTAVDYEDNTLVLKDNWLNLNNLFEEFTFEDGSPIGVEVRNEQGS